MFIVAKRSPISASAELLFFLLGCPFIGVYWALGAREGRRWGPASLDPPETPAALPLFRAQKCVL